MHRACGDTRREVFDVRRILAVLHQFAEYVLRQIVRAEVVIALESQHRLDQFVRHQGIAGLESRSARLGKRAGINDELILRIVALDARDFLAFVAQLPIGGVFQDQDSLAIGIATNDVNQTPPAARD